MITQIKAFFVKHSKGLTACAGVLTGLTALAGSASADTSITATTSAANAQFLATTGFNMTDLVTKVGSWIMMFLGAGLGLVDSLIGWIIALIVFGVIIGLIYKAMRFLHILR